MKTREIVYIVMDLLKNSSEDAYFTEDHILFLLKHHRALILKKEAERKAFIENIFNTQTICLDMKPDQAFDCGETMLKSEQEVPATIGQENPTVSLKDYFGNYRISFITKQKMKYVGHNRFMRNIIYCCIGPDRHVYMKSDNPQFINIERILLDSVFEDVDKADALSCNDDAMDSDASCDFLEKEFPIDSYLVPMLIDSVLKELLGATYRPKDHINDNMDNLAAIELFLRNNMKSNLTKQIEGNE